MEITKVTSAGRATIPTALRQKYSLKKGTKLVFIECGEGIMIQPLDKNYFTNLAGSLGLKSKMLRSFVKYKLQERKL